MDPPFQSTLVLELGSNSAFYQKLYYNTVATELTLSELKMSP